MNPESVVAVVASVAAVVSALYAGIAHWLARKAQAHTELIERIVTETNFDRLLLGIDEKMIDDPVLWRVYDTPPEVINIPDSGSLTDDERLRLQSFALYVLGVFNLVFCFVDEREKKGFEVPPSAKTAWNEYMKEFVEGSQIARELLDDPVIGESFENHFRQHLKALRSEPS